MNPETNQRAAAMAAAAMIMGGFDASPPTPTTVNKKEPKFDLGRIYATAAIVDWAETHGVNLFNYLHRHHCGDSGDLCQEDKQANEDALVQGSRVFSSYLTEEKKIYVITEADRSMTTILFASEY